MGYYSLPVLPLFNDVPDIFELQQKLLEEIVPVINKTLSSYINSAKCQIDDRQIEWSNFKKYTNPYEYIHTNIPNTKTSICKLKPISRSFYKMIETCNILDLFEPLPKEKCKTFHFAEGPGGFIEAIAYHRNNMKDVYLGMTLTDQQNSTIPGWKKSQDFLQTNKNVSIWTGLTKDGDMLKAVNLKLCFLQHGHSCDLVTGDGGFDFAIDYTHQEQLSLKLVFAQCAYAISCQKKGGNFFFKVFDTYTQSSIDILYFLSCVYEKVYIYKPHTSRSANSEKYVICKNYQVSDSKNLVRSMFNILNSFKDEQYPYRFLNIDIPYSFTCAIQEINAIIGQGQLECIATTLSLMDTSANEQLENIKKIHIGKCINWCHKFKLPHHKYSHSINIFSPSRKNSSISSYNFY